MEGMYTYKYPHPALTTDCVIFGFDGTKLQVLLVKRGINPYKDQWALPGGFVREDETCEQCAERELKEETGLTATFMEQFHVYSEPKRDPRERVVTIAFYALVQIQEVNGGDDAAEAAWFTIDKVPSLAFDHDKIFRMALNTLRERIHFKPIGFELMPEKFTLKQLQNLYEAILNVTFDRSNFSKKMHHLNMLIQLDEKVWPTPKREANLFRFNEESYNELKQKGFKLEF